jgi:hypothetical protein
VAFDDVQLAWAVRFAQTNLSTWRDGDWLNAWDDVVKLAMVDGQFPEVVLGVRPDRGSVPWTKKVLEALQSRLRDLFEQIDGIRTATTPEPPIAPRRAKIRVWGDWSVLPTDSGKRLVALYTSDDSDRHSRLVDALLLRVADLLTRIDLSRLRRCPECRRLFVAFRRQKFDTPQCSQRDRLRRFRTRRKPAVSQRPSRELRRARSRLR